MMLFKRHTGPLFPLTTAVLPSALITSSSQLAHCHRQTRSYASVQDGQLKWPASASPTPYEIFGLSKDDAYTKARFNQLVKLYHPDLHHNSAHDGISHVTKLERYRLVIAANDILSHPQKRRMYDLHQVGWAHHFDPHLQHRSAERSWRHEPGNASQNATWEDWEQWYQQRDGKKQEPVFMSNFGFATILAFCAVVGVWTQVVYAEKKSASILNSQAQQQAVLTREIMAREGAKAAMSREGRVETFLLQRELGKWDYEPSGHGVASTNAGEAQTP
ncbi:putative DnaJ domain-containing protein [Triangularia verruculosa]|uniref:DnaJ domain-containing protein n=1 Tax=Triangularia verruculosa TaxID=2587418 RepID=A0AAN6XDG0_9PEZI|nr:putative DnaJ domain-containing protein [Triangularia verruculosa]